MQRRALLGGPPPTDSTEAQVELVRGMVAGDERSWRTFHAQYDSLIYGCINKIAGRFRVLRDNTDVEEIYAALIVKLLADGMRKLRTFNPALGHRLGTWLGILAMNCARDHLRVIRREPRPASLDDCEEFRSDFPSPYEVAEHRELFALVDGILHDLPEKDREFVALYLEEELDVEEIAERMQISVKTVYTKKHKIHSRLGARLGAHLRGTCLRGPSLAA